MSIIDWTQAGYLRWRVTDPSLRFSLLSRAVAVAVILSVLAACTSVATRTSAPISPDAVWGAHQSRIAGLKEWTIRGRVSIKTEADGFGAALNWSQRADEYNIRLSAPLAQGSVEISGDGDVVTLRTKDATRTANDPDQLVYEMLGMALPVSNLVYWVRGVPSPETIVALQLDEKGRLKQLQQSGWLITIKRYREIDGYALPSSLVVENPPYSLRLAVHRWLLP